MRVSSKQLVCEFLQDAPKDKGFTAMVRWFGAKNRIAKWIVSYLPQGEVYVEPFCGSAAVLFAKEPWPVEVINDRDGILINLFRVMQNPKTFWELAHRLTWTPYSYREFKKARRILLDENASAVDKAWAAMVAYNQGFSGRCSCDGDWGRSTKRSNAESWVRRKQLLRFWHERLSGVYIDSVDGIDCITRWDGPTTVFYIDPPYPPSVRKSSNYYDCETSEEYHQRLVETLLGIKGKAVVSGYDHPLYRELEREGWRRTSKGMACNAVGRVKGSGLKGKSLSGDRLKRREILWIKE